MSTAKTAARSDAELMLALQADEHEAFEELYARYAPKVLGYLTKRVADRAFAEEILQECFLKVFRYRFQFDSTRPFAAWLFAICRNCLIDGVRKRKLLAMEMLVFSESEFAAATDNQHVVEKVYLGDLTSRERDILEKKYLHDWSHGEIAEKLGLTLVNVRKIASRAISRLRTGRV